MAKFFGNVGYGIQKEVRPGYWKDIVEEHSYCGDVIQSMVRVQASDKVNDDVNISNKISILSDIFANQNFHAIKYVEYMGAKWKVTNIEVAYPRLILTIGGVYNGSNDKQTSGASSKTN